MSSREEQAPAGMVCPYCGGGCSAMVRVCPHCDVRLENVRCHRCFSLQAPGAFACARCGRALELEPLLDVTDAPCPRCVHPLEVAPGPDSRIHECARCGGLFVPRAALAEILYGAERDGVLADRGRLTRATTRDVRYVPCPLCHATMNRVNFGRLSGAIVDVCKMHGTWFDAGELTAVVAFAASGGLERTRAREHDEQAERASRERTHRAESQLQNYGREDVRFEIRANLDQRIQAWRDFLLEVLSW